MTAIADSPWTRQRAREEVGLLLVVALETDAIARLDQRLEQRDRRVRIDHLASHARERARAREAGRAVVALARPGRFDDDGHVSLPAAAAVP